MLMKYVLLLFVFLLQSFSVQSQFREHLEKEISKIIYYDTDIDHEKIPGYIIAVQFGDSTYVYSYGSTTKDSINQPSGTSIFEIGGLTKVFTASLVNILVDEGILHYDSTLNSYLDPSDRSPFAHQLTIKDLVQHTSGLPRMPMEFGLKEKELNNPYAHYTNKDLINFYKNYYIEANEKMGYLYSHVNYALLDLVIKKVTGKTLNNVFQEKLFDPLNMKDTQLGMLTSEQQSRMVQGYSMSGKETPFWRFQSFHGSEGLKSTANDLLQFTRANLPNADQLFDPVLARSLAYNHQAFVDTKMRHETYAGNGWHIMQMRRYYDVILHAGATNGCRAFLGFVKENNTGVVVLSNSKHGTDGLGILILRMINFNWKKKKKKG